MGLSGFLSTNNNSSSSGTSKSFKGYVVNFGARDGKGTHGNTDPTYDLFASGKYAGLCVEGSYDFYLQLQKNMGPFNNNINNRKEATAAVSMKHAFIYPHNAVELISQNTNNNRLLKEQFGNKIHVFKIDIDSWDCEVIPKVVDAYRPTLVVAEYNIKFPPPLLVKMELNENGFDFLKRGHFYQCSLTWMLERVMAPRGYMILEVDWQNVMFIEKEVGKKLGLVSHDGSGNGDGSNEELYRWLQRLYARTYRLREGREKDFPFNKDIDFLLEGRENGKRVRDMLNWITSGRGCVKQDPKNVGMVVGCGSVTASVRPKKCPT